MNTFKELENMQPGYLHRKIAEAVDRGEVSHVITRRWDAAGAFKSPSIIEDIYLRVQGRWMRRNGIECPPALAKALDEEISVEW